MQINDNGCAKPKVRGTDAKSSDNDIVFVAVLHDKAKMETKTADSVNMVNDLMLAQRRDFHQTS